MVKEYTEVVQEVVNDTKVIVNSNKLRAAAAQIYRFICDHSAAYFNFFTSSTATTIFSA